MNLNDERNLLLAKKAVYAEQLRYYSKLCEAYQALAEEADKDKSLSASDIEKRYEQVLTMLTETDDLEKTMQEISGEYVFPKDDAPIGLYMGKKYSKEELKHLESFGRAASIFKTFQAASQRLDRVSDAEDEISRTRALSIFHSYMQNPNRPKVAQNFDNLLSVHSPRYLGSRFFLVAHNAIENISQIDQSHIPMDPITIREHFTPKTFGAIINGCKTISSKISELEQDQEPTDEFDIDNWSLESSPDYKIDTAEEEFNATKKSIPESLYVAGSSIKNTASRLYKAHKGTAAAALITATAIAAVVAGASHIRNTYVAHNLDVNSSTEYKQTITDETEQYLNDIIQKLDLQSSSFDPQVEDVKEIENNIDLLLDYVVKDQVTTAFEDYHKGYTVTDVNTWFDKSYEGTANEPTPYQFIDVSYLDETGKEGVERITDFRSQFLTKNSLVEIFGLEEDIDLNSPVWEAFNNNGSKNFMEKAESIADVMQYLKDAIKLTRNVAALDLEHGHSLISGTPYLKTVLPEKNNDEGR